MRLFPRSPQSLCYPVLRPPAVTDPDRPLTPAEVRKAAAIARGLWLDENRRLTLEDVASMLRLSYPKVRTMAGTGELSFRRIGGRLTISRAELDRDLDAMG